VTEPSTGEKEKIVPKLLYARVTEDAEEEHKVHKLAGSRHAPGDWIFRARIISLSWQGLRTARIAEELGGHPKTVRKRLHRIRDLLVDPGWTLVALVGFEQDASVSELAGRSSASRDQALEVVSFGLCEDNWILLLHNRHKHTLYHP
jgi:hypothetical protein